MSHVCSYDFLCAQQFSVHSKTKKIYSEKSYNQTVNSQAMTITSHQL